MIKGMVVGACLVSGLLLLLYLIISFSVDAPDKRHYGVYTSFQYPAGWQCRPEVTETVCTPVGKKRTSAIIIATSQRLRATDSFEFFERELNKSRVMKNGGTTYNSVVRSVQRRNINGQTWVVGQQFGSEVPGYETLYYATIAKSVSILFTFSYHQDFGTEHVGVGELMARTIEVY